MGIHSQPNVVRDPEPRDLFPPAVLERLSLVVEQTVARAGGVDAVASALGINKGRVSEWGNPDHSAWPNLRQIVNLERFAKVDWISRALAEFHGADLIKRGSTLGSGAVLQQLSAASREVGEALSASALTAAAPACPKAACQAVREAREAIASLKQLIAAVEASVGERVA